MGVRLEEHSIQPWECDEEKYDENAGKKRLVKECAFDEAIGIGGLLLDKAREIGIDGGGRAEVQYVRQDKRDAEKDTEYPVFRRVEYAYQEVHEKCREEYIQIVADGVDEDCGACRPLQERCQFRNHEYIIQNYDKGNFKL